jgi:hypothetical protein
MQMDELVHPIASEHLPIFITASGETDILMVVMSVVLAVAVLSFGLLFFRLHTLPERIAHKSQKIQFEIVAVLGLISLLTHMHIFWIVGLLLALIDMPDFGTSLSRIATSTEKIAGVKPTEPAELTRDDLTGKPHEAAASDVQQAAYPQVRRVGHA